MTPIYPEKESEIILAIESSCDDTAAAVFIDKSLRSNVVFSQLDHEKYGGVIPELASRKHQQYIIPTVNAALSEANITKQDLTALACTQGPGLMGSLLVGHTFAKAMSTALHIPLINVDHVQAHIAAHFIENDSPKFPFLCLLVSGGHTQLVALESITKSKILATTLDDAAGEAFDKCGKMLGLPYPAGPVMDKYAQKGNSEAFTFNTPKGLGLDFSFSGLKTSVLYFIQKQQKINENFISENIFDLCASIQHTIVSYLLHNMEQAIKMSKYQSIGIAGGVAANSLLRMQVSRLGTKYTVPSYIPKLAYCTDNAAMIGRLAIEKIKLKEFGTLYDTCYTRNE